MYNNDNSNCDTSYDRNQNSNCNINYDDNCGSNYNVCTVTTTVTVTPAMIEMKIANVTSTTIITVTAATIYVQYLQQ